MQPKQLTFARALLAGAAALLGYWLITNARSVSLPHPDLVLHDTVSGTEYWTFRTPREMQSMQDAHGYVMDALGLSPSECTLRSVAVDTGWPEKKLAVQTIVFSFYPCDGPTYYLATFTNTDRNLHVVAMPPPKQIQWGEGKPLRMELLSVDIDDALSVAGKHAGNDVLAKYPAETQVSLYLPLGARAALWEVRYDAWRAGKPLRYLVVTIDARTGQVTKTSG